MNQLLLSCKLLSVDIMGSLMFNHGLEVLKGDGSKWGPSRQFIPQEQEIRRLGAGFKINCPLKPRLPNPSLISWACC